MEIVDWLNQRFDNMADPGTPGFWGDRYEDVKHERGDAFLSGLIIGWLMGFVVATIVVLVLT